MSAENPQGTEMTDRIFKIVSIHTNADESRTQRVARLVDEGGGGSELTMTVDTGKPGDRFKISIQRLARLHFLHHYDRPNQGDILSGPYHYFDLGPHSKMSWDEEILKRGPQWFSRGDTVIMGGGIYFFKDKPRFDDLAKRAKHLIGWGLGLDERLELREFVSKFKLLGTRDRQSSHINGKNVLYVPCASCMNPAFDDGKAASGAKKPVALHINGGFNAAKLRAKMGGVPSTDTLTPFKQIMDNLSGADTIVTNSYHGAYWGSLMQKKVVCLKTEVAKWDGLHKDVRFADLNEVEEAIKDATPIPTSYFSECRDLNRDFYNRVQTLLER